MSNTVIISEIFANDVQKRFADNNQVLSIMKNVSTFIDGKGKTLHIPNALTATSVTINGSIAAKGQDVVDFTQTDITLVLDYARLEPIRGVNFEEAITSYGAFQAQTDTNIIALTDTVVDNIIYKIVNTASKSTIVTCSGPTGSTMGPASSTRRSLKMKDILDAKLKLDRQRVPASGRFLLLNPEMTNDLLLDETASLLLSSTETGVQKFYQGSLGQIYGFTVVSRAWTGVVDSGNTSQLSATSEVNTWNYTGIAFQKDQVGYALSNTTVFATEKDPVHYGTVISAEQYYGATTMRTGADGIILLVQKAS